MPRGSAKAGPQGPRPRPALTPVSPVLMEQGSAAHMALVGAVVLRRLAHAARRHSAVRYERGQIRAGLCPPPDSLMDGSGDWTTPGEAFVNSPVSRNPNVASRENERSGTHLMLKVTQPGLVILALRPTPPPPPPPPPLPFHRSAVPQRPLPDCRSQSASAISSSATNAERQSVTRALEDATLLVTFRTPP
ncbi:hypothetical protein P4O66_016878 [Electrophorus voltai]|uniref:Uncharacterized protein n=1 Tax=Electrophorus voltai TaxID=2609070 RepID=A0AAD9DNP7_9TELE|nr:hypothetical protein P4O66_016878 [Electrophorus voltai]